jgi:hypothetical protein
LILLGAGALLLLVAGVALWRMANSDARPTAPAPEAAKQEPPPPRAVVPDAAVATTAVDAAPRAPVRERERPETGQRRPTVILGRLREAVSRTDAQMSTCISGKISGRALLQFTAVPADGKVSIEHMEVLPNVGKERTSITDQTVLDCLLKAAAGTYLTDVGDVPVILRTRVVIDNGGLAENWLVTATPQYRED